MEPNASSTAAAWTSSPAAVVLEHGDEPSMRDTSLLSPAFSPALSPGLVPAPGSGSESSWYQQIPPSPAVAAGNGSLSVDAHAASSSQSEPSSPFPAASGTLPLVGYDLFGSPEATAATPLPTLLGGQWEQGEASSVLPECPSPGLFGFAGESAAWPSEAEETSCFFSPSSAGGLAPQSGDNMVGFAQPSLNSETEVLALAAVEESPVDATLPPVEEEEIDVSAFLASDPEDQLANASWTANPQMAGTGSGGGASASWMAPGSTGNNWPPMLAPAAASTACTMVSTNSGSMACHSVGSSIGVASSIRGMMKPSSPVVPLVPPSSQGAGASSSKFNGFAQPSSSSVLAPLAPNLQGPLLPVKQEVMEYVGVTERGHPDFISLVDDDEDGLYQDAMFGSWGSSNNSPASFAPGSWWSGSSSGSPSFGPGSWGGGGSSSGPSIAPGSWHSSSGSPSFDGNMPCFDQSMPMGNYRGKMASIPGLPPLPRACASSRKGGAGIVFTDPEKAIIAKDKKLQELLRTDPKKVKRTLYNRAYSAVAKVRKVMHTKNLERMIVTLEERRKSLREELQSLEEGSATLMAQKMEMQMIIGELEHQTMLKDAVREGLRAEIQNLKHLELN